MQQLAVPKANLDVIERTVESPAGTEKSPQLAAGQ